MNEYSKKIHLQSNAIARELLDKFSEGKDILILDNIDPTPEEQKEIDEQTADFAISIMNFLTEKDVTANYATFAIDKIVDNLNGLKQYIQGTLRSWEDEYLSRSYGIKNGEGKFRKEEITVSGLAIKLDEARKATGDNKYDFLNEVAPEMPSDESVASPYLGE